MEIWISIWIECHEAELHHPSCEEANPHTMSSPVFEIFGCPSEGTICLPTPPRKVQKRKVSMCFKVCQHGSLENCIFSVYPLTPKKVKFVGGHRGDLRCTGSCFFFFLELLKPQQLQNPVTCGIIKGGNWKGPPFKQILSNDFLSLVTQLGFSQVSVLYNALGKKE